MTLEVPRGRPGEETAPSDATEAKSTPTAVWRAPIPDALPRPHCRRCDTQLVNELQRKHGLCDPHITQYQAMRAAFRPTGAEPSSSVDHSGAKTAGSGFDAGHARDFLDALFGPISAGRIGVTAIGDGYIRNAHFQRAHEAVRQAETWDQLKPVGIYFRVTMLPAEGVIRGRGGAEDSHALNCMWADLDYGTIGHKPPANGPRLPADADEALTLVEGLPEVSILINSGGGLYPLWVFNEPVYLTNDNRPKLAKMAEGWQHRINKRAEQRNLHYGVGVGNLDRLLRLPGTINRKDELERPCRVIEYTGERLEL